LKGQLVGWYNGRCCLSTCIQFVCIDVVKVCADCISEGVFLP